MTEWFCKSRCRRTSFNDRPKEAPWKTSASIRERVKKARQIQAERTAAPETLNARLTPAMIQTHAI
jgi:predicted ATPase with chaperone activity